LFLAPAHVNGFYMSRAQRSLARSLCHEVLTGH
jgi:hypothetical protein